MLGKGLVGKSLGGGKSSWEETWGESLGLSPWGAIPRGGLAPWVTKSLRELS
jgi:hypothetical protein